MYNTTTIIALLAKELHGVYAVPKDTVGSARLIGRIEQVEKLVKDGTIESYTAIDEYKEAILSSIGEYESFDLDNVFYPNSERVAGMLEYLESVAIGCIGIEEVDRILKEFDGSGVDIDRLNSVQSDLFLALEYIQEKHSCFLK